MSILNGSELLLQISELSVAFAGFAGIGTALGEHINPKERQVDAGRLTNMLIVSLSTAMLALVPFIPTLFGLEESSAWRIAGVSALMVMAVFLPGIAMRAKRMKRYAGYSTRRNVISFGLAAFAASSFLSCALGFPLHHPSATYILGLAALLLISSILFFSVIVSFLRPHAPD
ncbi:MAG: hypothetical protein KGJ08_05920 [Gammaproteobacteria bacterium]|nr:hypothetical protein [Gammaproteobacteria bacterium]